MARYEEVKEDKGIKLFFKMLITNMAKALVFIAVLAVYIMPLYCIATSFNVHLAAPLIFIWVVLWIVILITFYQYYSKRHGKEDN